MERTFLPGLGEERQAAMEREGVVSQVGERDEGIKVERRLMVKKVDIGYRVLEVVLVRPDTRRSLCDGRLRY